MVYSLSPGVQATPEMGTMVSNMANMYRVTADDWDTWSDLETHFDVARCVCSIILAFLHWELGLFCVAVVMKAE